MKHAVFLIGLRCIWISSGSMVVTGAFPGSGFRPDWGLLRYCDTVGTHDAILTLTTYSRFLPHSTHSVSFTNTEKFIMFMEIICVYYVLRDRRWRSLLRRCATSRKVVGSIPDGVNGIFFIDIILPAAASNRNEYQEYFLGGKSGRCVVLTTLPPSCADCQEILWASTSWNPQDLSRPVMR